MQTQTKEELLAVAKMWKMGVPITRITKETGYGRPYDTFEKVDKYPSSERSQYALWAVMNGLFDPYWVQVYEFKVTPDEEWKDDDSR